METDRFIVGELLGETEQFRLYQCQLPSGGVGILKIAASVAENGILDREAFILQSLQDEAKRCEEEYAKENPGTKKVLNYQICFPNLVDSFIAEDQGGRRINILSFTHVSDDLSRLVPIAHLASRDNIRVDPKTSAWIFGKLLKILVFAHDQGISIGQVTGENILIERDKHFVAIFDWSQAASSFGTELSSDVTCEEISRAAKEVILALGGDPKTGILPLDPQLADDRYERYLHDFASGCENDASKAHEDFYHLIRTTLGWRGYHPFTSYRLERS